MDSTVSSDIFVSMTFPLEYLDIQMTPVKTSSQLQLSSRTTSSQDLWLWAAELCWPSHPSLWHVHRAELPLAAVERSHCTFLNIKFAYSNKHLSFFVLQCSEKGLPECPVGTLIQQRAAHLIYHCSYFCTAPSSCLHQAESSGSQWSVQHPTWTHLLSMLRQ